VDIDEDFLAAWKILKEEISESFYMFFLQLWVVVAVWYSVVVPNQHLKESGCGNLEDLFCVFQQRCTFIIDAEDNMGPISV